jgi:hypothetical protein
MGADAGGSTIGKAQVRLVTIGTRLGSCARKYWIKKEQPTEVNAFWTQALGQLFGQGQRLPRRPGPSHGIKRPFQQAKARGTFVKSRGAIARQSKRHSILRPCRCDLSDAERQKKRREPTQKSHEQSSPPGFVLATV